MALPSPIRLSVWLWLNWFFTAKKGFFELSFTAPVFQSTSRHPSAACLASCIRKYRPFSNRRILGFSGCFPPRCRSWIQCSAIPYWLYRRLFPWFVSWCLRRRIQLKELPVRIRSIFSSLLLYQSKAPCAWRLNTLKKENNTRTITTILPSFPWLKC